jgi:hypothetical protein
VKLILIVIASWARLMSQDLAHLSGVIRDGSGAVIRDATVTAVNAANGTRRSARSGEGGDYTISPLAAGTYKVIVRKPGFQTAARLDLVLAPGDNVAVDFPMEIGSVREVVTITSGGDFMRTDNAVTGGIIGRSYYDVLPTNGRTLTSLLDLVPAVSPTPASGGEPGQFSSAGQRPNTNYFTIDGLSANTAVTGSGLPAQFGGAALPAMTAFGSTHNLSSLDSVSELQVQTSTFAPEHGRMPGAHIALTTRSGSNALHGSAYHVWRHEALSAADWFSNAGGHRRAAYRMNELGASLGGPMRKDRTFFFADLLHLRLLQPYVWRSIVPSMDARAAATGAARAVLDAFPQPNGTSFGNGLAAFNAVASRPSQLTNGSLRIDHALTAKINVFGRYNQAPSSAERGFVNREFSDFNFRSLTLGATGVHGPALSYDLRLNVATTNAAGSWIPAHLDPAAVLPVSGLQNPDLFGIAVKGAGEIISGRGGRNRQGQVAASASLDSFADTHRFRLGMEYQRLTPSRDSRSTTVAVDYGSVPEILAGRPPVARYAEADQASSLIETLSVFVQDTWRPAPATSLTYGVRWEITPPPALRGASTSLSQPTVPVLTPVPGRPLETARAMPLWSTRYSQFAPRLGLAQRIGNAMVLRAGWGIFYNVAFSVATDPINGFPFNRWQFRSGDGVATTSFASGGATLDAGLNLPLAHHWNVAIERQLDAASLLSVSYIGSAGRRLLRREGLVPTAGGTFTTVPLIQPSVADSFSGTNHGESIYHGLAVHYRRPLSRRVQLIAAYTWSHAIDNGSWDSNVWLVDPAKPGNRDRASSSFDVRHSASVAFTWNVFRNWRASGLVRGRTGFPIDILSAQIPLGLGYDNAGRPDLVAGQPLWIEDGTAPGGRRLNSAAFRAREGLNGSLGRNAVRGLGTWQADLGINRQFTIKDNALDIRVDAFNVFNRANFADPVRFLDSPLFGQSNAMHALMLGSGSARSGLAPAFQTGGPRTVQLTLRFRF